jgi:hypothetical protein
VTDQFCCEKRTLADRGSVRERIFCAALLIVVGVLPPNAQSVGQRSDQEIVRQARQSYYSLKSQGLAELRCAVQPDWDSIYKAVKTDEVGAGQLLPILKGTHFTVVLGPDGASTISHESDTAPPNEEVARRVRQSIDGMEQLLTGFFQTWSGFMFNSILPDPDSKYHLEDLGGKYDLTFGDDATSFAIALNHDLAIEELKETSPQLDATLHPQWSPSSKGLVLTGNQAKYQAAKSDSGELTVKVEYQEVEGLSLPSIVVATIPFAADHVSIQLVFRDYQIKKR